MNDYLWMFLGSLNLLVSDGVGIRHVDHVQVWGGRLMYDVLLLMLYGS